MSIKVPVPTKENSKVPTEPGYYIAFFSFVPQLVAIAEYNGELRQISGPNSTHFTRWNVLWSEKLELV